jgi:hypothetical protein
MPLKSRRDVEPELSFSGRATICPSWVSIQNEAKDMKP